MYIDKLMEKGLNIFDQMPFEYPMFRISERNSNRYDYRLLDEFYLPIFERGRIKTFHFIPRWETSYGTRWEHEQAVRLNIRRSYLPDLHCL